MHTVNDVQATSGNEHGVGGVVGGALAGREWGVVGASTRRRRGL